jgi:ABC-2 type transport system ATP-binding protein
LISVGKPKELMEKEKVQNLEDVFIKYVEEVSNTKVVSTFEEMKFLRQGENLE